MSTHTPPCSHFGTCGGCQRQDMTPLEYQGHKPALVATALSRARIDLPIELAHQSPPGSRRRLALVVEKHPDGMRLGLNEARSETIVDLYECPVARPNLVALFPALREFSARVLHKNERADWLLTETDSGIDLVLERERPPVTADRQALAHFAEHEDIARISWRRGPMSDAEVQVLRRAPALNWSSLVVPLPPGGFLQATSEAEAFLQGFVADNLKGKKIVDLFSGAGALSANLLGRGSMVTAVDATAPGLAAYQAAARASGVGSRLVTENRDLFRRPLVPAELKKFDGALIDPPRQGGEEQAKQIARSPLKQVVLISCAPISFARDLAILLDAGYTAASAVQVIDQFLWSNHVETAIALTR